MSDFYSQIQTAVMTMIRDSGDLPEIKTWETDIRDALFAGDQLSKGFSANELPAVNVTAEGDVTESEPFTAGEIRYLVPVVVLVVARGQRKADVRAALRSMQWRMERLIHGARRSDNTLGDNAVVYGTVRTSLAVVEDKPLHFGVAQIEFTVLKVVPV